ncbi:helix-turn-helix domain-containing protein [Leeuwenhoekiella marinoflava]|uniref:Excisionase family DNA binding protein n=2 Tax=Leeuwenhoekiella marinoflava TaxID=988 RepID=A0A4Q0PLV0_9FLAO|nr:helix-turn-helix domain-containing protein [Leeuwenhoekiella marinoflava]RXG30680.1 excisionase family DNA binding protein [Leeuwenhoekiella marinoflava]SHF19859.1 DNA binding domain-containing protein, excisionase family [Leeuwenhoekiella marinoflava DSM 3653]
MNNPFEPLHNEIIELKSLVLQLLHKPEEDLSNKLYTLNEASDILKVDRQTVRNHIDRGTINATFIGRRILIPHNELFDALNEVKSIKYKR